MLNPVITPSPVVGELPVKLQGGLRIQGKKEIENGKPLLSIITATFNAAKDLPITIESIRALNYPNIEWIVVDGASKDASVELLRANEDVIDYWVSERDSGIYDAWNKGVQLATGEWISFLGAGDAYAPNAIDIYMDAILASSAELDFVSSRTKLVDGSGKMLCIFGAPYRWEELRTKYMVFANNSALHHRRIFGKHGLFDTTYASASDYDFFLRCGPLKTIYLDVVTSDMLEGGISAGYRGKRESYLIQKNHGLGVMCLPRYWLACVKQFIRPATRAVRRLMGQFE